MKSVCDLGRDKPSNELIIFQLNFFILFYYFFNWQIIALQHSVSFYLRIIWVINFKFSYLPRG